MPRVHLPDGRIVNFPDGMPEGDIAKAVASLADPNAGEPAKDDGPDHGQRTLRQLAWRMGVGGKNLAQSAKNHPGTAGAMAASLVAAPFTGGLSVPAAIAAEGAIGAGGAVAGHGVKAGLTGESASLGEIASDAALQGAFGAGGRALGETLQFVGNKLRGFKPPNPENAGGRLVPKPAPSGTVEDEMATALADVRKPALPDKVTLPPQPAQPRVTYPRQAAPKAAPKPQPAPKAAAPAPARIKGARAPVTVEQLPESWKPFAGEVPASAPKPQLAPRVSEAPLGLSDDAPMWGRTADTAGDAGEWRRALGADEAGAKLGMAADDVREASGYVPHRRPIVAELAEMDRDYLRRIGDPRGEIDPRLLQLMGRAALGGIFGGTQGGREGAIKGAVIGAAMNPKIAGTAIYGAGRLPNADLVRAAFLAAMSAGEQDQ